MVALLVCYHFFSKVLDALINTELVKHHTVSISQGLFSDVLMVITEFLYKAVDENTENSGCDSRYCKGVWHVGLQRKLSG